MKTEEFKNNLRIDGIDFREDDGIVIVDHGGGVDLNSLTTLPDNVKFENQGDVYLRSLTTLPDNVKFENQGYVDLNSLTTLPDNVKFENQGDVYLNSLTEETQFNYCGEKICLQHIDGYTMLLGSRKEKGEFVIIKSRYFGGGDLKDLKKCFIVKSGDHYAHGETAKEAVEDVRFKVMSSDFDKDEVIEQIRLSKKVSVHQYRLLTGACREGCRHFLESIGLPRDTEELPLKKVIKKVKGQYGGDQFIAMLG